MASKLKCPNCDAMLKEEGDEMKQGGEYRVYESLSNSKHAEGTYTLILCLECQCATDIKDFE